MTSVRGRSSGVLYHLDPGGRTSYVSSSVEQVLGHRAADVRHKPIFEIVHPDDQEQMRGSLVQVLHSGGDEVELEFRALHLDGRTLFVEASAVLTEEESGRRGILLRFKDVTERKTSEAELRQMASWFRALTRNSGDVIVVVDGDDQHSFVSGSSEAVLGYTPDALTPEVLRDSVHPSDRVATLMTFESVRQEPGDQARVVYRLRRADGRWIHVETLAVNRFDDPDVAGMILYTRDVTETRLRDDLTGLPNKTLFVDRLQEQLVRPEGQGVFAVLLVLLDRFELVKASLGPMVADRMLVQFSRRLTGAAREGWTVARVSDAQFAVLIAGLPDVGALNAQVQQLANAIAGPFNLAGQEVFSPVDIGMALSTRRYDRADAMLRDAEGALRKSREGQQRSTVADTRVIRSQSNRLLMESDLLGALDRNEFKVVYQPIHDLTFGRVWGVEALIRWHHPRDGLISSARFIPVAEETGLIGQIGAWVLRQSCEQLVRWGKRVPSASELAMSVNLSAKQVVDEAVVAMVSDALTDTGVDPERLHLEVTESALIDRPGHAARILTNLKELGVSLAIDDFGTGYSSLSYLASFPLDILKIDRSFVSGPNGMTLSSKQADLVGAMVQLGHTLGMVVIAEGIEDDIQAGMVRKLGCEFGQGYHLGKPMGPKALRQVLEGR
jgi:PAS domain S-box-containing protein/diguanylate cyclase (GGDEF)-like protein